MTSLRMDAEAASFSTDNTLGAFLAFLADEQVSARTARLYLAHRWAAAGGFVLLWRTPEATTPLRTRPV